MITKYFDINEDGYSVRCKLMAAEAARRYKRVVICAHGFGGNKDVSSIQKFAEKATGKDKHCAVVAFDWPCHGKDSLKKLQLGECFDYLSLVVSHAKDQLSAEKIYNYSVSFGAYVTLAYIHAKGNPFVRAVLRSTGIQMGQLMRNNVNPDDVGKLQRGKDVEVGFERKMKIDQKFLDDLTENDITRFEYYDWADDLLLIHGTKDEFVPVEEARAFADNNVIEFVQVDGSDHAFRNPKYMDFAIHTVVEFFAD